jgi:hypothetical protein
MNERKGKPQKLKKKNCAFPKCNVEFIGRGKAKYCDEHRKAKYRKELYKKNDNDGEAITTIVHDECYAKTIERECGLDGCEETFKITLIPRLGEYPNFCPDHRNPYKRSRFVKPNDS